MDIAYLLFFLFLLFLSAFFSGSETALFSLSSIELQRLKKHKNFKALQKLLKDPYHTLNTIIICNIIVNTVASSLFTRYLILSYGEENQARAVGMSIFLMTIILLIFGEITPKNILINIPAKFSIAVSPFLNYAKNLIYPLEYGFRVLNRFFISVFDKITPPEKIFITEDEINTAFKISSKHGHIDKHETKWMSNILKFSEKHIKDVMTDIKKTFMLSINSTKSEITYLIKEHKHSRIPVYSGDKHNIVGILYAKDYFLKDEFSFENLRLPLFLQENDLMEKAFNQMRKEAVQMAVIKNSGGEVTGIITIEDILEEIIGEIYDEND